MAAGVAGLIFCFFFLSLLKIHGGIKKKSNQPLKFVVLQISSLFFLLQFLKFRILYEIKGFFNFIHVLFVAIFFYLE
jgi:hypothetical protein